jgi:hypothetical protein
MFGICPSPTFVSVAFPSELTHKTQEGWQENNSVGHYVLFILEFRYADLIINQTNTTTKITTQCPSFVLGIQRSGDSSGNG